MLFGTGRAITLSALSIVLLGSTTAAAAAQPASPPSDTPAGPAIEQFYSVVREAARGLSTHTVYRPADLREVGRSVPVVIWGNGGCIRTNQQMITALTLIAAHGFIVIADGPQEAGAPTSGGVPDPGRMTGAIDWLTSNPLARGQFEGRADLSKIAVIGQSCGGLESLVAGADPRVASVTSLNSGFFPDPNPLGGVGREHLAQLHTPTLFVHGGPTDVAYRNSVENYQLVTVPALLVGNEHGGHAGLWLGLRDDRPDAAILEEAISVVVQWLDFTLNGNRSARDYFLGPCGLCTISGWTVESKGL